MQDAEELAKMNAAQCASGRAGEESPKMNAVHQEELAKMNAAHQEEMAKMKDAIKKSRRR